MKFPIIKLLLFGMLTMIGNAQESITFATYTEAFSYAENNSFAFRNATQQSISAKYRTLAAKLGMFNLKGAGSLTLTDNTKLNVNFIPAELFGGPEGTYRAITFGQKYTGNVLFEPQIDLINPYAMAQVKIAKANEQLTKINNLLNKKAVYESISAAYHNILSYKWQIDVTSKSLSSAETLLLFVENKKTEGIARSQDVNLALSNQLIIEDKLQQLQIQQEQQYNSLKILCDINPEASVIISSNEIQNDALYFPITADGDLLQRQGEWQTKYQKALLRADKRWRYPTLNFFSSFGWQESSNVRFFQSGNWLASNYIGIKLSIPLLPEITKIAAVKYDRINLEIAENYWNHSKLQEQINNNQLELDYKKASESYLIATRVEALSKDSYQKNLNIYREGLISATDLINSFDQWLNSSLNKAALLASVGYAESRIIISNSIK